MTFLFGHEEKYQKAQSAKSLLQTSEGFFVFKPWCENHLTALTFLIIIIIPLNLYYYMMVKYGVHLKLSHSEHFRNNSTDSDEIYSKTCVKNFIVYVLNFTDIFSEFIRKMQNLQFKRNLQNVSVEKYEISSFSL